MFNNLPQTIYCERGISLDLLSEPINAISNIAFIIIGFITLKYTLKDKSRNLLLPLSILLFTIGIGSFLYHTARNSFTLVLDGLPIYILILYSIYLLYNKLLISRSKAVLILLAFLAVQILLSSFVPREFLNGSIRHFVTLIFALLTTFLVKAKFGKKQFITMLKIVILYSLAIFFRSIDSKICVYFSIGTHFLWHILSASSGYYIIILLANIYKSENDSN